MMSTAKHPLLAKLLLAIGLGLFTSSATTQANDVHEELLKAANNHAGGEYLRKRYLEIANVPFSPTDSRKKALIIGDSHAQDFFNAVLESGALANYQIRTRYIPNICQLYLGSENISGFIAEKNHAICAKSDNLQAAKPQIAEADVIILVSSWKGWSAERLPTTLNNLRLRPEQTLRVVGRKSFGKVNIHNYLRQSPHELRNLRNPVDEHQPAINATLKQKLDPNIFVDIHQIICGESQTCPVFTPELQLISFDGGHLTPVGAKYIGKLLFSSPLLANL